MTQEKPNERTTDLRNKIMPQMRTCQPWQRLAKLGKVQPDDILAAVITTLSTIPITETNELIFSSALVILEMLGQGRSQERAQRTMSTMEEKVGSQSNGNKEKLSQLSELQRGSSGKGMLQK